jgi:MerR family redox-sensitive transcriptional activator SoxR
MNTLSIGQVARKTGIRTSALRYYEEAGILPVPDRVNGRRTYDADTIRRVDVLRFAQQAGFTLDEIKTLFHGFGATTPLSTRWQKLAKAKLIELDELAARVQSMRRALEIGLKCGCVRIEDCSLSADDATEVGRAKTKAKGGCGC